MIKESKPHQNFGIDGATLSAESDHLLAVCINQCKCNNLFITISFTVTPNP